MQRRIYLDQAATSWPKLESAIDAADEFIRQCGATSGRGAYGSAQTAEKWVMRARLGLSRLVGANNATDVAFCSSGTHALNAAIYGWLRDGEHVVTTAIEHNSVLRPLRHLHHSANVSMSVAACDAGGYVDPQIAAELINDQTRMLIVGHASNVTGRIQDLAAWGQFAKNHNLRLVVDASQTLGYVPIDMQAAGVDVLVSAGHKGLRALPGSGFVVARRELQEQLRPLLFGGTGIASESLDAENVWPHSVEVGNLNLPAVVSMAVAAEHLLDLTPADWDVWRKTLVPFLEQLRNRIDSDRLQVIGHDQACDWLPVVSLLPAQWDIHEAAAVLDANFGIEARAGYHCAALVHQYIGSQDKGGTLRLSLGHHTSAVDLEDTVHALASMLGA